MIAYNGSLDKEAHKNIIGRVIDSLCAEDPDVVYLDADLMNASGAYKFWKSHPGRAINCGIAEADMIGIAAGLSSAGKKPYAHTFGPFASRRCYDQVFLSVAYSGNSVRILGSDAGVTAAFNGGTHMPFEDMGIMRNIPKLVVFEPSDPVSLKALVQYNAGYYGCTYMRLFRKPAPLLYPENETFTFGKGKVLRDGGDVTIIAIGVIPVNEALRGAELLEKEGISAAVIDMHTLKPIDEELILQYAEKTGAIVTFENHQIYNGLGSAVAEVLVEKCPTRMKRIGVNDEFGEVGTQEYLQQRYGLTAENLALTTKQWLLKT